MILRQLFLYKPIDRNRWFRAGTEWTRIESEKNTNGYVDIAWICERSFLEENTYESGRFQSDRISNYHEYREPHSHLQIAPPSHSYREALQT